MLRTWGLFLSALIGALMLGYIAIMPPAPKSADAPSEAFSARRAMTDVRIISANPHPTGSQENAKVRAYLSARLEAMGGQVEITQSPLNDRALKRHNQRSKTDIQSLDIFNIIATFPGSDPSKPALLLMAHHDTVPGSPGAADDTIGIASIFEIIRAMEADGPQPRTLIVLLTDAEELGLNGAKQFFKNNPMNEMIGAIINFEARGGGGTANMFQTSAQNGNLARFYAKHVSDPSTSSLSTYVYNILPNDTDLTPALEKDYVAYNIANIGRAEYYHSPKISPEALDLKTLQHMGSQGLDLTRAFLTTQTLPSRAPDAVFFDAFGIMTFIYAPFWGWIFIILGALFYIISTRLKPLEPPKQVAINALKMLAYILIGAGLLWALNWLSGAGGNYYDRLAAISKLEGVALSAAAGLFLIIFGSAPQRGNHDSHKSAGFAVPIFALAIAGQIIAPTASYFLSVPLMLCGAAALIIKKWPSGGAGFGALTVIPAALVAGYMLYLGHQLMLGVGPDLMSVAIVTSAIAALAILPIFPGLPKRRSKFIGLGLLALAIIIALWIRLDPVAVTIPDW